MKQTLLALVLTLCLLLSACGGPKEEPSSAAGASEAASLTESVMDSSHEENLEDPEALGRFLWEQYEALALDDFAMDYDMDMTAQVDIDGESTKLDMGTRVRQVKHEGGDISYQIETEYLNTVSKTWYSDGMMYLSAPYGNFKAPMDMEAFQEAYINDGSSDLLKLGLDDFGTLTGEKTDDGYVIRYGDMDMDTWRMLTGLINGLMGELTDVDEMNESCKRFVLSGTVTLDKEFRLLRNELTLGITFDILGTELAEDLELVQVVNGYNESVRISVPEDDESFVEMSDLNIPTIFSNGFNSTLGQAALTYQDTLTLEISDESRDMRTTYIQQDDLTYTVMDDSLQVKWDASVMQDGEVVRWSSDSYAGGEGILTDETGEEPYTYDDESFSTDIANLITLYADSFDSGSGYQLIKDGDRDCLTFDLSAEYVQMLFESYLESYATGIDYTEAAETAWSGTVSIWFDTAGCMVSQRVEALAELTYETGPMVVTLVDQADVLAMGEDVHLAENAY